MKKIYLQDFFQGRVSKMAMNINSLFSATQYSYLFNSGSSTNKKSTASQNSINSMWSNYSSNSASSSAMNVLSGLSEIKAGVSSVMSSYNDAKDAFYSEFDDAMSSLKKSAGNVKKYDFSEVSSSATDDKPAISQTTSTDEDGKTVTTTNYSDKLKDALKTVQTFVDDYNNAANFLADNSSVSARVSRLSNTFSDATYRAADYESVGIKVQKDGTLSVDEEKLANSIVNNPDKVSRLVGSDGLAAKAESHVSTANAQRDSLFPSAKSMLGDQLSTAALYTGGTYARMASIANVGNLVNMMF